MLVTTSKVFERGKDKCRNVHSDGYEYGSKLFNFTKGVQRHVYLALVERVKLWTTVQHDDASHSEARSKDNARYRVVNGKTPGARWKGNVCVTRVTIRIYETAEWETADERRTALFLRVLPRSSSR